MAVYKILKEILSIHRVVLFLHGTKSHPQGYFSENAVNALVSCGIDFLPIDITFNTDLRSQIVAYSGWGKFPQMFVDGEFIGGSFVIPEFLRSGELNRIIKNGIDNHNQIPFQKLSKNSVHMGAVWSVKVSSDGAFVVSGSADRTVRLWSLSDGDEILVAHGHDECIWSVCASTEGKYAITVSADKSIMLWELDGLKPKLVVTGHNKAVTAIHQKGNENRFLSVLYDSKMMEWDYNGQLIKIYKRHTERIWSVTATNDGEILATVGADKKAIIWQPRVDKIKEIDIQDMPTACCLSPNGEWLIVGSRSGKLNWFPVLDR